MLWLDESYNQICFNYGQWWGNKPVRKRQEKIDLMLTNQTDVLVGECMWRNKPVDEETAALLQESGELVRKGRRKV